MKLPLYVFIVFGAIYFNGKVWGESDAIKLIHNNQLKNVNHELINKINQSDSKQKSKVKVGKISINGIKIRKQLKLSKQLAAAKQECWDVDLVDQRIINGTTPKKNSLSWMVALFKKKLKKFRFCCGGSLISTRFVLSAAHCVLNKTRQWSKISYSRLSVRYGVHDLSAKGYMESRVVQVFPHPQFRRTKGMYCDIALIKLEETVTYSPRVSPICIPFLTTPTTWNRSRKKRAMLISGWGQTTPPDFRSKPKRKFTLQKGIAFILNTRLCEKHFSDQYSPRTTLCIGNSANRSTTCKGDSGSPISPIRFRRKDDSIVLPVVIGLVSFGNHECDGPTVITKVRCFITWINKITYK